MITYDAPTHRSYPNNADQWQEWKRQAHAIGFDEAKRHSSVSTGNRHKCHDCFCCACIEYVAETLRERDSER